MEALADGATFTPISVARGHGHALKTGAPANL